MEAAVPFLGNYFRLCSYSWSKRVIVYFLISSFLWSVYPRYSYSFAPVIAAVMARQVVPKVIGRVMARRFAANEAVYTTAQMASTRQFIGRAAANSAEFIPAKSALRIGGVSTWAGVATTLGSFLPSSISSSDGTVSFVTEGEKRTDGSYGFSLASSQNGVSYTESGVADYEPTILSPVIANVRFNKTDVSLPSDDISVEDHVSENMPYYYFDSFSGLYYSGSSLEEIALRYVNDENKINYKESIIHFKENIKDDSTNTIQPYDFEYPSRFFEISELETTEVKPLINLSGDVDKYYIGISFLLDSFSYQKTPCVVNADQPVYCAPPEKEDYTKVSTKINKSLYINSNAKYIPQKPSIEVINIDDFNEDAAKSLDNTPLDVGVIRDLINNLWMEAMSQSDYNGVPLNSSITSSEVSNALSELGLSPTYLDLLSPISVSPGAEINIDISLNNNSGNNTDGSNKTDLGEDPKIASPELEETPTADEILKPVFDLLPFTQNFDIGSRPATCPVVSFSVFEHDYKIDSHCPLIEGNRAAIQTIFLIIWGFIALRVTLSA